MSFAEMKKEVVRLSDQERLELITLLEAIEDSRKPEFRHEMTEILDDRSAERWIEIKDGEDFLGKDGL